MILARGVSFHTDRLNSPRIRVCGGRALEYRDSTLIPKEKRAGSGDPARSSNPIKSGLLHPNPDVFQDAAGAGGIEDAARAEARHGFGRLLGRATVFLHKAHHLL